MSEEYELDDFYFGRSDTFCFCFHPSYPLSLDTWGAIFKGKCSIWSWKLLVGLSWDQATGPKKEEGGVSRFVACGKQRARESMEEGGRGWVREGRQKTLLGKLEQMGGWSTPHRAGVQERVPGGQGQSTCQRTSKGHPFKWLPKVLISQTWVSPDLNPPPPILRLSLTPPCSQDKAYAS